ncbi:hypothetical protein Vadar_017714 [Vaccinium darrowii]|uniref:Uncharacterized protein n=1 Tax=Vaccinium darrowii TaxID=229202 RepID=A0ACB7XRC1_9ERIC|nr:hypothetical protein Vadar_017714 [Vaccinium darrowii]
MFGNRQIAFAFFKFYSFGDGYSEETVQVCCVAAHLLAAERLRCSAQDLLSWVVGRIGFDRSWEVVEYMCSEHYKYETDFSVLDSLMRAFLNAEMAPLALEMVDRMREVGVKPSLSAVNILFKLLLRIGDYGSVWKLFRDMVDKGPFLSNYTFNAMILGFVRKGYLEIGEYLSYVMEEFQFKPDACTYNILINAYCIRGRTSDGLALLRFMIERGCNPSNITFNTLINALCKEGNVVEARKLFDGIQEMGLSPNTIMYNTLISGYVKARDIKQANMLFEEMRNSGVAPDGVTFNILVVGHYKYGREEDGNRLLRELSMSGLLPDSSLSDISVAGLCWAGRLDEAMGILEEMLEKGMNVSVIAFNSVIAAYSNAGLEERAFEAYKLMVNYGLSPSSSTCSSLLMALSIKGRLLEAKELMSAMIDKCFPVNKVAFTILLDGYFKTGDIPAAQGLWEEMERRGMSPDAVAFSAIIDGLSKAGLVEEAYGAFLKMSRKGFVPNNYAYNSLIGGFVNCGRLSEALKLEKEMRQRGLLPDVFTMNIIINGFCKQGRMKSAIDTFMDMHRMGLTPDIVTYNTLISGYCKAFDMVNLDNFVNKLHASGWDPDITTYNIRIHGFCSSRRMNRAVMMLDELVSSGVVPNTVTYNTMMTGVCNDILDRAMILTAKLLKMAFVPNIVTTNLLLSHLYKQGLPERTLMWGQKLSEICVDFDDITFKILDKAYHAIQEDAEYSRGTSGKSLFLDFLMYITYDYLCRCRIPSEKGPVELAAVGVAIAVFNQVSKIAIFPLVSVTMSFVGEEDAAESLIDSSCGIEITERRFDGNDEAEEFIPNVGKLRLWAAKLGSTSMAAFQICLQVWLAASLLANGLAVAGRAILASAFAKRDFDKAAATASQLNLALGLVLSILVAVILQLGSGLLTDDTYVLQILSLGILFVAGTQPINALAFVFDGVNFGASDFVFSACSMARFGPFGLVFERSVLVYTITIQWFRRVMGWFIHFYDFACSRRLLEDRDWNRTLEFSQEMMMSPHN